MKRALFLLIALFLVPAVYADVTANDIAGALPKTLTHPYLFFSDAEKPAIIARIQNDPGCRDYMARLTAEADSLLKTPVEPMPPQFKGYDPEGTNPFMVMYYAYRTNAYNLAFMYQMTGDARYAEKSFEFAREICDMPTWVLRECQFPFLYPRVWPWNVPDDQVSFTYEIVSSDTAMMLALVYDWLYPGITREQRDQIRGALIEHAISRVRGNWDLHWWATAYRCNWVTWCCDGVGIASLALLNENPGFTDIIAESYNRIMRTFDEFGEDGDWGEGASYWSHLCNKPLPFNVAISRLTGGKYNPYTHPKIQNNPVTFPLSARIPPDRRMNFADSRGIGSIGSKPLLNRLVLETGDPAAAWLLQLRSSKPSDILDLISPTATVQGKLPEQASRFFRKTGIAVLRSDFTDPEKVTVTCRAGKNDDPHHGHLDTGQFMVYWRGEAFIRDLGAAGYEEGYFGTRRYENPMASSVGHNVVFVNGEKQIPGKVKDTPFNPEIGGQVLEYRPGASRDYVLMDCTKAYPGKQLLGWRRHVVLDKPEITVVLDEVSTNPGARIEVRFHSEATETVKDGYVLLTGKKGMMALIPVAGKGFAMRPGFHDYLPALENADPLHIPYVEATGAASGKKTVLAHIVIPVANEAEAKQIAASAKRATDRSGNLTIAVTKSGKKYTYTFAGAASGLVLR